MWLKRPPGDPAQKPQAATPAGFAEAPARWNRPEPPPREADDLGYDHRAPVPPPDQGDVPFPNTGPIGHRGRMRDRLLDRGPDSLADYEMLEMLLFFAFKTGDTKPLAKSLINRYGSFACVLSARCRS